MKFSRRFYKRLFIDSEKVTHVPLKLKKFLVIGWFGDVNYGVKCTESTVADKFPPTLIKLASSLIRSYLLIVREIIL